MRINDMNTVLAAVRDQLMEKEGADDNNMNARAKDIGSSADTRD